MPSTPSGSDSTPKTSKRDARPQWTLKGVSLETRQAVTKAAKRDNMKLGEWVDRALRDKATETLQGTRQVARQETDDEIRDRLDRLSEQVERLATERERAAGRGLLDRLFRRGS